MIALNDAALALEEIGQRICNRVIELRAEARGSTLGL